MMGPIQATTRTLSATFKLEDTLNSRPMDFEKEMIDILTWEMFLETPDQHKPIIIEVEQYDE